MQSRPLKQENPIVRATGFALICQLLLVKFLSKQQKLQAQVDYLNKLGLRQIVFMMP